MNSIKPANLLVHDKKAVEEFNKFPVDATCKINNLPSAAVNRSIVPFVDVSWIDDNNGCGSQQLSNQVRVF